MKAKYKVKLQAKEDYISSRISIDGNYIPKGNLTNENLDDIIDVLKRATKHFEQLRDFNTDDKCQGR